MLCEVVVCLLSTQLDPICLAVGARGVSPVVSKNYVQEVFVFGVESLFALCELLFVALVV